MQFLLLFLIQGLWNVGEFYFATCLLNVEFVWKTALIYGSATAFLGTFIIRCFKTENV